MHTIVSKISNKDLLYGTGNYIQYLTVYIYIYTHIYIYMTYIYIYVKWENIIILDYISLMWDYEGDYFILKILKYLGLCAMTYAI